MYLSKLELHGFKSFASPTVLRFDPGITAIVGPNGCGKSNIVDAVRWVIGEQRARILRSEKMENVIFNGTAKRRPLGLAEVQLTVENTRGVLPTEYTEVTLGRRLYRSGDSEYLLNGTPCRLRDIIDLFMDTGMGAGAYSVIELKMIEEILSDSTYDRRHLFEEAAGITKYKQRRAQALRKLDGTQADLTRLRDLTEEIEKRVRSLKRQAAKAARYKEVEARLHHLELALAQVEYNRLAGHEEALEVERATLKDALEEHTARLAKDDAELEVLRTTHIERERVLSERQQRLSDHMGVVRDLEADVRLRQERLDGASRDRERTEREQDEAHRQRLDLEATAERLKVELAEAEPLREEADRMLHEAEAARDQARATAEERRKTLHDLRRREQGAVEERAGYHRRLDRLANRLELLEQEQERTREQEEELGARFGEHEARVVQAEQQLGQALKAQDEARETLARTEREHEAAQRLLDEAVEAVRHVERQHDAATAEKQLLDGLIASFDDFPDAVQFLAATPSWTSGKPETVADLLTCDAEHRVALSAVLDGLGACLVVADEQEAYQAVALLRDEQKGKATFLVLNRLPPDVGNGSRSPATGGGRPLRELVRVSDPAYEPLASLLLRDCYYVETLAEAKAYAERAADGMRYVTTAGEWIDARGLLHAGSEGPEPSPVAGRMGHREHLDAVREHLAALENELEQRTTVVDERRMALDAVSVDTCRQALAAAEREHVRMEQEKARHVYEREAVARRRVDLTARLDTLRVEIAEARDAVAPLKAALAATEAGLSTLYTDREAAEHAFQEAEAASRAAQDRLGEANVAAVEARNRCDNLGRDRERVRRELETLERRVKERQAHLETLRQTIADTREQIGLLQQNLDAERARRAGLEAGVAEAKTALLQVKVEIDQVEVRLRKLRQAREKAIQEENVRAVRQAEIQTRKEDMIESVRDNFGVVLGVDPIEVGDDFEVDAARAELRELRQAIKSIGGVNALALEEYEVEKERFEFMAAQQEDLEHAEATLLETIDEINTTASRRFMETYESIRASFRELFSELFGHDAAADLELVDPDDPLESPIEIVAKPRGKRPIHITQLSSGEKTLTAIALLFAIYLVKPSPFCFLDEVDAPLDDANVDRFMHLIRRFSNHTQFVLVTHNKRTMELADRLYGITMQEQGVSRLVGVKFEEALAMAS